ncbi:DUF397 domain-containing protein [Amycolatopsis sp. A1MSW2902]
MRRFAELTTGWEKSRFSGGQNGCVEFHFDGVHGWVGVRDSKLGDNSPVLAFNKVEFDAFIAAAQAGQFTDRIQ